METKHIEITITEDKELRSHEVKIISKEKLEPEDILFLAHNFLSVLKDEYDLDVTTSCGIILAAEDAFKFEPTVSHIDLEDYN